MPPDCRRLEFGERLVLPDRTCVFEAGSVVQVGVQVRRLPVAGTQLCNSNAVAAGRLPVCDLPARWGIRVVNVGVIAVFVQPVKVQVRAPAIACMAVGVTMHVQPADLHGEKARTRTKKD